MWTDVFTYNSRVPNAFRAVRRICERMQSGMNQSETNERIKTRMKRFRPKRYGMQIPICSSSTGSSPRPLRLHLNSASTVTVGNSQTQQEQMFASLIFGLTMVASRAWSHLTHSPLEGRFMIYLHRNGLSPAGTADLRTDSDQLCSRRWPH